jgi:acyl-CoA thioesterase I
VLEGAARQFLTIERKNTRLEPLRDVCYSATMPFVRSRRIALGSALSACQLLVLMGVSLGSVGCSNEQSPTAVALPSIGQGGAAALPSGDHEAAPPDGASEPGAETPDTEGSVLPGLDANGSTGSVENMSGAALGADAGMAGGVADAGAGGSGAAGGAAGAAGTAGPGAAGGGAGGSGAVSEGFIVPNPLISRAKPVFASMGSAAAVNDGGYRSTPAWYAGTPTEAAPAWVAIQVGVGPKRVLLSWTASGNYNYTDIQYGAPASYRVESSADSTNGNNGTWRVEATVTGNSVRTRAHSFEFDGRSWVRLSITGAPDPTSGVSIDEIDVHDASDGTDDSWLFFGDSITAFAYDRDTPADQPSFAENIHALYPGYFPALINGGIGGETTNDGLRRLATALQLNPDYHYVGIGYGTNDAWSNALSPAQFRTNLQSMIDRIVAAGRVPVLARIPFSPDGNHTTLDLHNQVIDQLTQQNRLLPGPDFYAWFQAHPEQLTDQVHPGPAGRVAMNRLWAEAMDALYAPQ